MVNELVQFFVMLNVIGIANLGVNIRRQNGVVDWCSGQRCCWFCMHGLWPAPAGAAQWDCQVNQRASVEPSDRYYPEGRIREIAVKSYRLKMLFTLS